MNLLKTLYNRILKQTRETKKDSLELKNWKKMQMYDLAEQAAIIEEIRENRRLT